MIYNKGWIKIKYLWEYYLLEQKTKQFKSEAKVLMIAYKDKQTPLKAKILIAFAID